MADNLTTFEIYSENTGEALTAFKTVWHVYKYSRETGQPYRAVRVWWTEQRGEDGYIKHGPAAPLPGTYSSKVLCELCGVEWEDYRDARYAGMEDKVLITPKLFFLVQRLKGQPVQQPLRAK